MPNIEWIIKNALRADEVPEDDIPKISAEFNDVDTDAPINRALRVVSLVNLEELLCGGLRLRLSLDRFPQGKQLRHVEAIFGQMPILTDGAVIISSADHGREVRLWPVMPQIITATQVDDKVHRPIISIHARNRDTEKVKDLRSTLMRICKERRCGTEFVKSTPEKGVALWVPMKKAS